MTDTLIYCRRCGKALRLIPMRSGRWMPCECWPVAYIPDPKGTVLYEEDGTQVRGFPVGDKLCTGAPMAWRPHWGLCAAPEKPRKKRLSKAEREAEKNRRAEARAQAEKRYQSTVAGLLAQRQAEWRW